MKKGLFILLIFCFSLTIISCSDEEEESTTDTTAPVLAEVTAVTTPTNDTTPDYTFSSSEAGTITYGGSCSSRTRSAFSGNNTITLVSLSEGTYSDCTIKVTDTSGTILTSSDGISWDNKSSGTSVTLSGVTYENNKFLTLGISGSTRTMLTSSNGTSWTSTSWTCSACQDPDNNSNQTYNFTLEDVTYRE